MIMAEEDEVDRRQIREANAGLVDALRTGEGKWRGAPRPDGIGQYVQVADLNKQGGVAHHRHAQPAAADPLRRPGGFERTWPGGRPFGATASELSFQEFAQRARLHAFRIEECAAVEMVADRS